jgi:hypothetical protein
MRRTYQNVGCKHCQSKEMRIFCQLEHAGLTEVKHNKVKNPRKHNRWQFILHPSPYSS